jgi:hypothetical protein
VADDGILFLWDIKTRKLQSSRSLYRDVFGLVNLTAIPTVAFAGEVALLVAQDEGILTVPLSITAGQ